LNKKKSILFFLLFFFSIQNSNLEASSKLEIVKNFNNIETLKFNFSQITFEKKEEGTCFLKRPHFLKCIYEKSKNQKELIVNGNNIVIYHKKYEKTYYYPTSRSFFLEILDKKKFKETVLKSVIVNNEDLFEIKYVGKKRGEITFFFGKNNFNIVGWKIIDLNGNKTNFKIENLIKNQEIKKEIFTIPEIN
tara:strand:+ start:696 stop:1268 length:573 start_codon:yes stop_codon:yes gene_type:complete